MRYAYFLSENRETDCYSTSFECSSDTKIEFYGWDFDFDLSKSIYIAVDDTRGELVPYSFRYENSKNMRYYTFIKTDEDIDRNILTVEITGEIVNFDLLKFRRDLRINKILDI